MKNKKNYDNIMTGYIIENPCIPKDLPKILQEITTMVVVHINKALLDDYKSTFPEEKMKFVLKRNLENWMSNRIDEVKK